MSECPLNDENDAYNSISEPSFLAPDFNFSKNSTVAYMDELVESSVKTLKTNAFFEYIYFFCNVDFVSSN